MMSSNIIVFIITMVLIAITSTIVISYDKVTTCVTFNKYVRFKWGLEIEVSTFLWPISNDWNSYVKNIIVLTWTLSSSICYKKHGCKYCILGSAYLHFLIWNHNFLEFTEQKPAISITQLPALWLLIRHLLST